MDLEIIHKLNFNSIFFNINVLMCTSISNKNHFGTLPRLTIEVPLASLPVPRLLSASGSYIPFINIFSFTYSPSSLSPTNIFCCV